jgi:hypothetical protein
MNFQYISDNKGKTTGVYIPIQEWEKLKEKFKGLGDIQENIPEWHIKLVNERLEEYEKNPDSSLDFNSEIDNIEKEL